MKNEMKQFLRDLLNGLGRDRLHGRPAISAALVDEADERYQEARSRQLTMSDADREIMHRDAGECGHGKIGPCRYACDNERGLPEPLRTWKPKAENARNMLRTLIRVHGPRTVDNLMRKDLDESTGGQA